MRTHENSSKEPEHLVRVQKRCPRLDCPKPTIGIAWRGSEKQWQYHCYYGGVLRSWAKQVRPPNRWLRRYAQGVKNAPKLLELQPPIASRSGPSWKRTQTRPSRRSVAKSSATEDDTTNAVYAAETSQKRTRRATVNHVTNKEVTAIATSGEDHGTGIAGNSTLPSIDVVKKLNVVGDEEALHGPGTRDRTPPTSDNTNDKMNDLDDLFGDDGDETPVWQSFKSPEAHVLWDHEVQDGAGIVSVAGIVSGAAPVADNDSNPTVQGTSGLLNAQSGDVALPPAEPRRRAMKIKFRGVSKTVYYGHQD